MKKLKDSEISLLMDSSVNTVASIVYTFFDLHI